MLNKEFNLNANIKVKLNDMGYQILVDEWNEMCKIIKSTKPKTIEDFKNQADENGYTTFQAWSFIQKFGKHTGMGFKQPYHPTILI